MPKERSCRGRSLSFERSSRSPYPCSSSCHSNQSSAKIPTEALEKDLKEWEEARCPVCMDHPHNAVLLICSSHGKGCRPYMCDTSYRHSNCLDQFRKNYEGPGRDPLLCPLCRGPVENWVPMEPARRFMNAKARSCSRESCGFSGSYGDLRQHARSEHPLVRPSEADPDRQRDWTRLERQRDLGDVLSTIQSAVLGDDEEEDNSRFLSEDGSWLTVYFLIRVFRPMSGESASWTVPSRVRGLPRSRRRSSTLWGETYEGETGPPAEEGGGDIRGLEGVSGSWRRRDRSRRRTTPDNNDL